jgi:hypothetical protein
MHPSNGEVIFPSKGVFCAGSELSGVAGMDEQELEQWAESLDPQKIAAYSPRQDLAPKERKFLYDISRRLRRGDRLSLPQLRYLRFPRIMLESHYFLTPRNKNGERVTDFCPLHTLVLHGNKRLGSRTAGPFVALQPGTDQVTQSIGAGIMWGFKYSDDLNDAKS